MKSLFWHWIQVTDGKVPVFLSHHSLEDSKLTPIEHGCTIEGPNGLEVYIDASMPRDRQNRVVGHEFVHVCLWGKKSLELHHKKEEQLADVIGTTGWRYMQIPRRPKGAKALEVYARKYDGN